MYTNSLCSRINHCIIWSRENLFSIGGVMFIVPINYFFTLGSMYIERNEITNDHREFFLLSLIEAYYKYKPKR